MYVYIYTYIYIYIYTYALLLASVRNKACGSDVYTVHCSGLAYLDFFLLLFPIFSVIVLLLLVILITNISRVVFLLVFEVLL